MNRCITWVCVLRVSMFALVAVGMSSPGLAAEGAGVRGGGTTVDIAGRPRLRDLVDKSVCRYVNASTYFFRQDGAKELLAALEETHWYFADAFRREMKRLKICLTENLIQLPSEDWDGVTLSMINGERQIGIRFNDKIFLDEKLFTELPVPTDRVDTLIHEVVHSFIPIAVSTRHDKVKSIVNAIRRNFTERLTEAEMALHLEENRLSLTSRASSMAGKREPLKVIFDPNETLRAKYLAFSMLGSDVIYSSLFGGDLIEIFSTLEPPLVQARIALERGNVAELKAQLALGIPSDLPFFADEKGAGLLSLLDFASPDSGEEILQALFSSTGGSAAEVGARLKSVDRIAKRAILGDLEVADVRALVRQGVNPNALIQVKGRVRYEWRSLIASSVRFNHREMFAALLESGRVTPESYGETYLEALAKPVPFYVQSLLARSDFPAKISLPTGRSPLAEAFKDGNLSALRKLLNLGADPNERGEERSLFGLALNRKATEASYLICSSAAFEWSEDVATELRREQAGAEALLLLAIQSKDVPTVRKLAGLAGYTTIQRMKAYEIAQFLKEDEIAAIFEPGAGK